MPDDPAAGSDAAFDAMFAGAREGGFDGQYRRAHGRGGFVE
jgi:hypothetical protein